MTLMKLYLERAKTHAFDILENAYVSKFADEKLSRYKNFSLSMIEYLCRTYNIKDEMTFPDEATIPQLIINSLKAISDEGTGMIAIYKHDPGHKTSMLQAGSEFASIVFKMNVLMEQEEENNAFIIQLQGAINQGIMRLASVEKDGTDE